MKTNEEIRIEGLTCGVIQMKASYFVNQDFIDDFEANDAEEACEVALDYLMDKARLDVLTTMENLALWKGGNTAEEKIQHFFKVLQMAKDELTQT